MRTSLRGIAGIAATGFLAWTAVPAGAAQLKAENELLGVRIWREWRTVLQKWGPPTKIEVGAATGQTAGGGTGDLGGFGGGTRGPMGGGGLPGLGGMGLPSLGGAGGMSSGGGMMGMMGRPGGGSMYGGMMGGMSSGGRGGGMMGMMGGGEDVATSASGGPGMMGGGMGGGGFGGAQNSGSSEGEVTWIYERGPSTFMFLFNKDGKVIQIQEFGYSNSGGATPTARLVKLGDPVARIYQEYGWADTTINNGNQLILDYSTKAHVAFQLLNQGKGMRIVGITVAQTERNAGGIQGLMFLGGAGGGMGGAMGGGMAGPGGMAPPAGMGPRGGMMSGGGMMRRGAGGRGGGGGLAP